MESESCGMRGKEGGWDEWKTIDAAMATVDVEDTLDDTAPRIFHRSPVSEFQL